MWIRNMKLTKILLSLLILTLPLIHGRVLATLGLDFELIVSGNFEFTKSLYFNVFSSLIFLVFFVEYILIWGNKLLLSLREKYILICVYTLLCISTYFSLSPFMSLIWDLEKWHTFFLVSNLIGLYIVMRQISYSQRNFILQIFILSWVLSSVLAIKELYYPSFNYGALWDRALWSFGHPNYLSGFLLLLLPFIFSTPFPFAKERIQVWIKIWITLLFLTTIILCKSLTALFLAGLYLFYYTNKKMQLVPSPLRRGLGWGIIIGFSILAGFILIRYFPEKLHSLISRWYLWETTVRIIFSDIKILVLWAGLETLPYYFNSFKVPELYIFENFGYSADRPHNFFLNIFYHFGLAWIWIFIYLFCKFFSFLQREYQQEERWEFQKYYKIASSVIILFLLYWIFHYFSISSYLIIIFTLSILLHDNKAQKYSVKLFFLILIFTSIIGWYISFRLYVSEIYYSAGKSETSLEIFSHPKYLLRFWETEMAENREWVISQRNYKTRIILMDDAQLWCDNLLTGYPSAENYFYCWQLLESQWDSTLSKNYYNTWLSKMPDLWNENSIYWDNYFVKQTITGNRFFSPKFWDINSVLEKIWIKYNN